MLVPTLSRRGVGLVQVMIENLVLETETGEFVKLKTNQVIGFDIQIKFLWFPDFLFFKKMSVKAEYNVRYINLC